MCGFHVADTSALDREFTGEEGRHVPASSRTEGQDHLILETGGKVRGWIAVDAEGELRRLDEEEENEEKVVESRKADRGEKLGNGHVVEPKGPADAVLENEIMK